MLHETFELQLDYNAMGIVHEGAMPTVTTYILDRYPEYQRPKKRPLVVICPGGGYGHHSPREGEAIAVRMNSLGYQAVVLRYSLAPNEYPCALLELAKTVAMVREHIEDWELDENKIVVAGFSAGGHLAASLGTEWNKGWISKKLGLMPQQIRPNAMLLSYPVITSGEFAHRGSFEKLLGLQYDALVDKVSLENNIDVDTPPAFIWHTFEDGSVPVENSLLLAKAMREQKVHFELHIFPYGGHGLGLATEETNTKEGNKLQPECAVWPELFATWIKNLA